MSLSFGALATLPAVAEFDRDDGLDLVGPLLGDHEAEIAALAVQQQHARADLVDQREIAARIASSVESQRGTDCFM